MRRIQSAFGILLLCVGLFCLSRADALTPQQGVVLFAQKQAQGNSAQVQQFFNRLATLPSAHDQGCYAAGINIIVAGGAWSQLDALWVAGPDAASTLTELTSGTYSAAINGAPTFTAYRGFTLNGINNDVQTTFNPALATHLQQNSAFVGAWQLNTPPLTAVTTTDMIRGDSAGNVRLSFSNDSPDAYLQFSIASNGTDFSANPLSSTAGFFAVNRTGTTTYKAYQNNVDLGLFTGGQASQAPQNATMDWFGNGSVPLQIPAVVFGAGLTDPQLTAVYSGLQSILHCFGTV